MKAGIIGLPSVGKKTLYHLIRSAMGVSAAAPVQQTCMVKVPDPRLDFLNGMFKPKKLTPTALEVLCLESIYGDEEHKRDVLVQLGACDLVMHVVRVFPDPQVYHVRESVDPERDIREVMAELTLCDLYRCEKRIEKLQLELRKKKDEEKARELVLQERFKQALEREIPLRDLPELAADELKMIRGFQYYTLKNVLLVLNLGDDQSEQDPAVQALVKAFATAKVGVITVRVKLEAEIAQLQGEERELFLAEMKVTESGLHKIVREAYRLLGLITFFTVGEDEVRAWPVKRGTAAQQGAGEIHSDIERGFIRAEIAHYDDLKAEGTMARLRELGKYYLKGKDYVLEDGDIACYRFNV